MSSMAVKMQADTLVERDAGDKTVVSILFCWRGERMSTLTLVEGLYSQNYKRVAKASLSFCKDHQCAWISWLILDNVGMKIQR